MEGAVCGLCGEFVDCVDGGVCHWAVFGVGGEEVGGEGCMEG